MKIKSIEDFTLEECEEYLKVYPDGPDRVAVEERLENFKKNKSKQELKKSKQEPEWIDIRQFISNKSYEDNSRIISVLLVPLLFAIFLFIASWNFSITEHTPLSKDFSEHVGRTTGVERLLLNLHLIQDEYNWHWVEIGEADDIYMMTGWNVLLFFAILGLIIWLLILLEVNSPSLKYIYNIEYKAKTESRRTQNRDGKFGLHRCGESKIVQVLPFEYDNIYYCGGNSYICVKGNKRGVYNTNERRFIIELEYDTIDIMQDGNLRVMRNGVVSKFTAEGYRVIE